MKKQLMRYKLIADQKVGRASWSSIAKLASRANKSEVLTDELLQIEKRLEHVRVACLSVYKRISQCLQSTGPDIEKRMKKLPETAVANAMLEASNHLALESDSALQKSLKVCAEAENGVAKERALYELFVEGHVVTPLNTLVETDIPNIQKMRERLKRLVLDRDNATQAWQKAHKAQYHPGVNMQAMAAKADAMKEEMDAATTRMEQCKDQLITELFEFLSKEGTYAQHVTDFVSKELEYHRRCVAHLERLEPEIKAAQENAYVRSSYGCSLVEHLRVTDRQIAMPIESCISCLTEIGMYEEGLFRVAGGAAKLKKFRALADAGVMDLSVYDAQDDIHAVAGALKQYLRELPDPLLTQDLYQDWLRITSITDNDTKLKEIWTIIEGLPAENKANLRYLIKFCSVLAERQEYNKMSAGNIALVFSPNLLWTPNDDITANMMVSNSIASIIESMILYSDYFFPGAEPEFSIPPPPQVQEKNPGHGRTPSFGNPPDAKLQAGNQTSKSPSHSRNSSSDTNVILNHSNPNQTGEGNRTLTKKKKHAPPAPPGQRTSPTPVGNTPATGESTQPNKPPIASKRTSMRQRPNMPPPDPPEITNKNGAPPGPNPRPRPKPPARKKVPAIPENPNPSSRSVPANEELPPPLPDETPDESGFVNPPMLDLPPPPPPDMDDSYIGPGLSSELANTPIVTAPLAGESSDEDEGDFIVTSL